MVSGGSDWSVSSLNPLDAIEVGITHRDPGDTAGPPWNPAERVDLPTMIALYTINAAWAHHLDRETGSIEVGKLADLIVLDRNLFDVPAERIHEARVVRTLLEGRTVFHRDSSAAGGPIRRVAVAMRRSRSARGSHRPPTATPSIAGRSCGCLPAGRRRAGRGPRVSPARSCPTRSAREEFRGIARGGRQGLPGVRPAATRLSSSRWRVKP